MAQWAPKDNDVLEMNPFATTTTMGTMPHHLGNGYFSRRRNLDRHSTRSTAGYSHSTCGENVDNNTTQSKPDCIIRKEQLKNARLNECQNIEASGIPCGDCLWKLCDNKAVSLFYLSLVLTVVEIWFPRTKYQDRSINNEKIMEYFSYCFLETEEQIFRSLCLLYKKTA